MQYLKRILLTTFLILGLSAYGWAQITVSGTVIDSQSLEPLIGVNIVVKGTPMTGTTTNLDGKYTFRVPSEQDTLVISYIGYIKKEVPVNGRTQVNIQLAPDVQTLEDVIVIGYGTTEKADNTGSVSKISASDFKGGSNTSPQELIQGKIAGVNVTPSDGAPGSGATIRIRGGASLSASNDPLFVVDGLPLSTDGVNGTRNPLNSINPEDIQDITVLKDASATAIYGSRASGGVVIITTKKGEKGQPTRINYNFETSLSTNHNQVDVLNADEFRDLIGREFGQDGLDRLGDNNINWQDVIYSSSISQDHSISVTGSIDKLDLPFRASFGFNDNDGILETSENKRFTTSLNLNPSFFDDHLKMNINLKGTRTANNFANRGAIGSAVRFDPTKPVRVDSLDRFGGFFAFTDSDGNPIQLAPANPRALLDQTSDVSNVWRGFGNVETELRVPKIDGLTATLNLGFDYSTIGTGEFLIPDNAAFADDGTLAKGVRRNFDQDRENETLEIFMKYEKELPGIDSKFDVTGGYTWERNYETSTSFERNFNVDDTLSVDQDIDFKTERFLVSTFGRVNYSFKDRYLVTSTLRRDGTSRFLDDNRWGIFPSVAFAWKAHQEPLLEDVSWLSELKFRTSWGRTGQQSLGLGNFPALARFTASEPNAEVQFGDEFINTLRPEGFNSNLKWEVTRTINAGLDFGLLDNRITGTIEGFLKETDDLLNQIPVPAGTNFTNQILTNIGTLKLQGIEFGITGNIIETEDTFWQTSINTTWTSNRITQLTNVQTDDFIGVEVGGIAGGVGNTIQINSTGFERNSFFVLEQVVDENGKPIEGAFVDQNGDGVINDADRIRFKSPTPDVVLGISSNFQYKNWDASFSGRANIGNYVYNNVDSQNFINDLVSPLGFVQNATDDIQRTEFQNAQFLSDTFIENGSFFRMDNITVGYTLNDILNTNNTTVRISATVENAFVITNYSGLDPEVFGGIDNNLFPRPRKFLLGINVNL